ncbi:MAG: hydrogenase subunit MbhD domain-containing protein [Candidatus Margulisiibacteriota bacterium]
MYTCLITLMILMLGGALLATLARNLMVAISSLGITGLFLCVIFLLLNAPDLAISLLVFEAMVLLILPRAAKAARDNQNYPKTLKDWGGAIAVLLIIFAIIFTVVELMPQSTETTTAETKAALQNTSLLFGARLWDLAGLVAVLTAATIGAAAVLRLKGRKALNERDVYDN